MKKSLYCFELDDEDYENLIMLLERSSRELFYLSCFSKAEEVDILKSQSEYEESLLHIVINGRSDSNGKHKLQFEMSPIDCQNFSSILQDAYSDMLFKSVVPPNDDEVLGGLYKGRAGYLKQLKEKILAGRTDSN